MEILVQRKDCPCNADRNNNNKTAMVTQYSVQKCNIVRPIK